MWGSAPSAVDHEEALLIYAGKGGGEPGRLSRT